MWVGMNRWVKSWDRVLSHQELCQFLSSTKRPLTTDLTRVTQHWIAVLRCNSGPALCLGMKPQPDRYLLLF